MILPVVCAEIEVEVSAGRAWRAFLNVGELLSWLCDGAVVGDQRGGRWALGWYLDGGDDGATSIGTIGEALPGEVIVVEDVMFEEPGLDPVGPMELEFRFQEVRSGATLVSVLQSGFGDDPPDRIVRDRFIAGWKQSLGDLKIWLETGVSPRHPGV